MSEKERERIIKVSRNVAKQRMTSDVRQLAIFLTLLRSLLDLVDAMAHSIAHQLSKLLLANGIAEGFGDNGKSGGDV